MSSFSTTVHFIYSSVSVHITLFGFILFLYFHLKSSHFINFTLSSAQTLLSLLIFNILNISWWHTASSHILTKKVQTAPAATSLVFKNILRGDVELWYTHAVIGQESEQWSEVWTSLSTQVCSFWHFSWVQHYECLPGKIVQKCVPLFPYLYDYHILSLSVSASFSPPAFQWGGKNLCLAMSIHLPAFVAFGSPDLHVFELWQKTGRNPHR